MNGPQSVVAVVASVRCPAGEMPTRESGSSFPDQDKETR